MRTALVAVTLLVPVTLAGCGSTPSATSKPDPHRRRAVAEARTLVGATPVPPGARVRHGSPPDSLAHPMVGVPGPNHLVDVSRVWVIPATTVTVFAWITAHRPPGMALSASTTDGVAWSTPDTNAYISAQLQVAVAPDGPHAAYMRADGMDVWLSTAPMKDTIRGRRLRVTVSAGCPTTIAGYADVANSDSVLRSRMLPRAAPTGGLVCRYGTPRQGPTPPPVVTLTAQSATRLARAVNAIPLGSAGNGPPPSCPVGGDLQTLLVFSYRNHPDADLWLHTHGCRTLDDGFVRAVEQGTPTFYKGFVNALAAVAP